MKKDFFILLIATFIFFSCNKENNYAGIEIRVHNATALQIENINIIGADHEAAFDTLTPGFSTGYKSIGSLQGNLSCIFRIKGQADQTVSLVDDSSMIHAGYYTCTVNYTSGSQVFIDLVKD